MAVPKQLISLPIEQFIHLLSAQEKLALLKGILNTYDCITVVVGSEKETITSESFQADKTLNDCLIIKTWT